MIFKCFVVSTMLMCTDKPIDATCMEAALNEYKGAMNTEIAINLAASECVNDGSGCCSWHGGVAFFDNNQGIFVCNDGWESSCKTK